MSIVFKPDLKKVFSLYIKKVERPKVKKPTVIEKPKPWIESEINSLVELRALRVPMKECVFILNHSYASCYEISQRTDLNKKINDKRMELIKEATK